MSAESNDKVLKDFFRENYADESLSVPPKVWGGISQSLEGMRLAKGLPSSGEANNSALKDYFHQSYTDQVVPVSPAVWDKVAANLEEKREEKRRRRGFFWMWAALIGVLITTGTTYYFWPSDHISENEGLSVETNRESNYANDENLQPAHSTDSETSELADTDVANLEPSSELANGQEDALNDDQAPENESSVAQQFDQTSSSDASADSFSSVPAEKFKSGKESANGNKGVSELTNDESVPLTNQQDDNSMGNQVDHSSNQYIGTSSNQYIAPSSEQTSIQQINKSTIQPIPIVLSIPPFWHSLIKIAPPPPKVSPWEFGVYAGFGKRNRVLVNDLNSDDLNSKKFTKLDPQQQRYRQTGIQFGYNVGSRLTIGFGIQTALWKYRSREFLKMIVKEPVGYEMDAPVGRVQAHPNDLDPFYESTPADTLLFRIRMNQNLRYVSLPLSLKLKLGTGKVQPYIRAGVSANILYWQRTHLVFRSAGIERTVERVDVDGLKRLHFSGQGAFGFQWKLAPKVSMFAEGALDIPLGGFYKTQAGTSEIRSSGWGGNIGFIFGF